MAEWFYKNLNDSKIQKRPKIRRNQKLLRRRNVRDTGREIHNELRTIRNNKAPEANAVCTEILRKEAGIYC